jgi:hypothetical protein
MVSTYARRALLVVVPFSLCAQVPIDTTRSDPEREFETALEETTQDAEDSQLVDLLTALLEHPLDINTATIDELTQIPGITPIIAFHIVTARDSTLFTSPDQLLRVEGITDELFERIRDFVCVIQPEHRSPTVPFSSLTVRVRTVRDLQQKQGFLDGSFQGSAWKVYSRLTARSHRFGSQGSFVDVGLLTEKDAGENSFSNFLAGYLSVYLRDYSSSLLVGDFTVEAAEGLVFWRSIGFSKGSEVISTVKKGGVGIRPYLSTDENWYFRGVAGQVDLPGVSLSAFYSSKPLHASVNSEGVLTSFYSSGLFRTESELLRRSTAHSTLIGGRATGSLARGLKVGGSLYQATFSPEVMQSSDFGFKGRRASMFGMDISFTRPTFSIFTEGARSSSKSVAAIGGVIVEPVNNFEIALVGRYYPKEFKSLYGNGFGETHSTQNETGIYTAARVRLSRWLTVSSYFDQYSFPWKSGTVRTPSHGNDFLLFSDVRLSDRLSLELRYRHHNKPDGEPSGRSATSDELSCNVRVSVIHCISHTQPRRSCQRRLSVQPDD